MILDKQLYGQRAASVEHNKFLCSIYEGLGYVRVPQQPQYLWHAKWQVLGEIHQDDIQLSGPEERINEVE